MTKRPNILLFITDQHRADYLGCSGHPVLKTPHIDSIAARGTALHALLRGDAGVHAQPLDADDRPHAVAARRAQQRHAAVAARQHLRRRAARRRLCDRAGRQKPFAEFHRLARRSSSVRRRARAIRCSTRAFAEAMKPVSSDGPYDQETSEALEGRPRLRDARCPSTASSMSTCARRTAIRSAATTTVWLKSHAARRRCAARSQEPVAARLRLPQAFRTPIPEELYPTVLYRREKLRLARQLRRGRRATSRSS